MWEKWVMLATLAACTCLMRGTVGDIVAAPGGERFILATLDEAQAGGASGPFVFAGLSRISEPASGVS